MDRPATIKDVARLAQVHPATASRALNPAARGKISASTVERVLEVARSLGYQPNSAARSLRTRTSSVAGVLIPDLRNPVFPPIVRGIEDGLRAAGYMALIGNTDGDVTREREILAAMRSRQTDGVIVATARRDGAVWPKDSRPVPTVLVNRRRDAAGVSSVVADNADGVDLLVGHLHDLGHLRIAHVAGPVDVSTGFERYRAFVDACARRGIGLTGDEVRFCAAFSEEAGLAGCRAMLDEVPDVTAIVAGNDLIALGCLAALAERGLSCPGDVSLTGFNDTPFLTQTPRLTTVRIPHYEIGLEAARLLLERIVRPATPVKQVVLPVTLVERDSTAPAHG